MWTYFTPYHAAAINQNMLAFLVTHSFVLEQKVEINLSQSEQTACFMRHVSSFIQNK